MKKVLSAIGVVAFIATIGWQQQPTYKLKLTETEIQTVLGGLSKLPYEQSAGVINKIVAQAQDTAFQKSK